MVWLKHEFPWLGSYFLPAVAESYADTFAGSLRALGFGVVEIDGVAQVDDPSFWAELKRAFRMPDYFARGWDGMDDCWRDGFEPTRPVAVMWRSADYAATAVLPQYSQGIGWLMATAWSGNPPGDQMVIVICGSSDEFPAPSP